MLKPGIILLVCCALLGFTSPTFAQILSEDGSAEWEQALQSPGVLPELPDYIAVDFASAIFEGLLLRPDAVIQQAELAHLSISADGASTIYQAPLFRPDSLIAAAEGVSDFLTTEYATTIHEALLARPDAVVDEALTVPPFITNAYASAIFTVTMREPLTPDNDDDGDGVIDTADNCPSIANTGQTNVDGDVLGDACDVCPNDPNNDFDSDGICGNVDNCPSVANLNQANSDGDAFGDICDLCPYDAANDADLDGYCADLDNCPAINNPDQADGDNDGIGDACDPTDDDADRDGILNEEDNCPGVSNPNQANADGDALGDACDPCPQDTDNDADGDGVCGNVDNCPLVANANQANLDGDGLGNACDPDADGDGVGAAAGDCNDLNVAIHPGAVEICGDGIDQDCNGADLACEIDSDGDGVSDDEDNCPTVANPDQVDLDGDAIGDLCDDDVDDDGIPNNTDSDDDDDGMPDECEQTYASLDPFDASDAAEDFDSDGLTNIEECRYNTDPNNPDTDGDGVTDADEVDHGSDPTAVETIDIINTSKEVLVSLTGDNIIYVKFFNNFLIPKSVQFNLSGLDSSWYTIATKDREFTLPPLGWKVIAVQLHLPEDCTIPAQTYPFTVHLEYEHNAQAYSGSDSGDLVVTPNPNIYRLAIPQNTVMAGNNVHIAWKTDIPTDGYVYYRKAGDDDFTQAEAGLDMREHRVLLQDLEFLAYYEYYTESRASCGGMTSTELAIIKTGKAVKFVDSVNEFWVDRDYYQPVTLSITNTDVIEHTFKLSVVHDYTDIVIDFVGEGSNGRQVNLSPGASMDVELMVHAQEAHQTDYDIYLKIVSDPDQADSFVDYSRAIIHVRPFVANLVLEPVVSVPGKLQTVFRMINYGDPLSDIEVYVDDESIEKVWLEPSINHLRLVSNPEDTPEPDDVQFVNFTLRSKVYTTGTVYARSGDYVVSAPFEIGCPEGTDLNTYTLNDLSVVAQIKDWYCTNKKNLELPFAAPMGIKQRDIREAAVEVNFSLPMSMDKYDPHTVKIYINKGFRKGGLIATLEDVIPNGQYLFRFPVSYLYLGDNAPLKNLLTVEAEDIGVGQYIVATDFKIILNVDEMKIELCVPDYTPPPPVVLPPPSTKIVSVGPDTKFRPGETVNVTVDLQNTDSNDHRGILTITLENNSNAADGGGVNPAVNVGTITVAPGDGTYSFDYTIPEDADDIEYRLSAVFENQTLNESVSAQAKPVFYVRTPLIIVHGIMGSKMVEKRDGYIDDVVWGGLWDFISYRAPDFHEGSFRKLSCDVYGNPVNPFVLSTRVFKELKMGNVGVDTFAGLESTLLSSNYIVHGNGSTYDFDLDKFSLEANYDEDVFYFVYDWRMDSRFNAVYLRDYINKITDQLSTGKPNSKVNIAVHSMGGLVFRYLLNNFEDARNRINKAIFIGTPHLGAVKAFSGLNYGENDFGISKALNKEISSNINSLYQLLPSFKYFENYPGGYYTPNDSDAPINDYNLMKLKMADLSFNMDPLFKSAESLHSDIDSDTNLNLPADSYNIVGCKKCTTESVVDTLEEPYFLKGDGDATVPVKSAMAIQTKRKYVAQYAEHSNLPSWPGVRKLIRSILNGYENDFPLSGIYSVNDTNYQDYCGLNGTRTFFRCEEGDCGLIFPRIRISGGKPGEFTGESSNGIHIGIVGSDYRVTNEGVEIYVPEGAIYTLEFNGVDQEYLNVKFQLMTEGGVIRTYIFENIAIDIDDCGEVTFDLTNAMTDPVLRLDDQCDGTFEQENISASHILDENESNDFITPITTAEITGTLGENGWYLSNVSISLNVLEEGGSGLLATRYRFSGDAGYTEYAGPIQISVPGTYTMTYFSIDRNLNKETEKALEIRIEDAAPQIVSVIDGDSVYELDSVDLCWEILTSFSPLQDIEYSVGTAPGLTDIRTWTDTGSQTPTACAQIANLTTTCGAMVYFNIWATNIAGRQSDVASSDGVIILSTGGDPDGDTFLNEVEIAANSDPCNRYSIPKNSIMRLNAGFNMVAIPADLRNRPTLNDWLPLLGTAADIEKVLVYDGVARRFITLIPGSTLNPSYPLQGGEALIAYAKRETAIGFTSALCNPLNLAQGYNFIGAACASGDYTAFDLLSGLGNENTVSIQRYNTTTGKFESAAFNSAGRPAGVDFSIVAGEGYMVNMRNALTGFAP